jgi:hypothetical protein
LLIEQKKIDVIVAQIDGNGALGSKMWFTRYIPVPFFEMVGEVALNILTSTSQDIC